MNSRNVFLTLMALLLSACLPFQKQQLRTLSDLGDGDIAVHPDSDIDADRKKALQRYKAFLAANPDAVLEREARRRVADLQLEIDNASRAASGKRTPKSGDVADDSETENLDATAKLYEDLLNTYPNQNGNDQILYQLARAYDDGGRQDDAYTILGRLVTDYPESSFVPEAYFRRAELNFLRGDYALAEPQYRQVLAFGEQTPFYQQARYKLGWSLFKQESYEPALAVFFACIDSKLKRDAATTPADLNLPDREIVDETLSVVSLSFSYLGGPDAIDEYFAKHPNVAYEDQVYSALAALFQKKERYFDAARTLQSFADRHPMYFSAPVFLTKAIETYRQARFQSQALDAMTAFAERYDLNRPYWQRHSPSAQKQTVDTLRETLDALARHFHALAQKSHAEDDYARAVDWYRRYLADFPAEPQSMELHYRLAEALFEVRRYDEAAVEYERTAYAYPDHAWNRKAANAAVVAFDLQAETVQEPDRKLWHLRALASRLRLADRFPDHSQAAPALARATQDYFALEDYEPAAIGAERLLKLRPLPASSLRRVAWLVQGHIDFDQRDFPGAENAYREALALMMPNDKMRPDIEEKFASSIYQQGDDLRKSGDLAGAANQFLRVAAAVPGSAIVAAAEYDAAAALITLKQWPRAIAVLARFRAGFPNHELREEVSVKLAAAYLENGQGLEAAREFEHLGTVQGEPGLRQDALWRSAELYAKAGETSAAARVYKRYVDEFPGDFVQGMEARQRLADLNLASGNTGRYLFWLKRVIEADQRAGDARTDRSRTLAARASLVLARSSQKQFDAVALKLPLKQSLKTKKKLMERTLAAYKLAMDYGIAEVSTAAAYDTAEIYHGFSRALMKSQRPKGLSADELEEYNLLLEEQAYPFEEDAIAIHEDNSRHVNESIYNDWVKASYKVLAEMLPVRYAKPERSEGFLDVVE
ncbi:MAG: tetratricopeptide repeat protein [Gammaproteobacteria bacterium]|nr:tetratricopeptide repeat protein [Gammaproteobacteria bacterium]